MKKKIMIPLLAIPEIFSWLSLKKQLRKSGLDKRVVIIMVEILNPTAILYYNCEGIFFIFFLYIYSLGSSLSACLAGYHLGSDSEKEKSCISTSYIKLMIYSTHKRMPRQFNH